MGTRMSTAQGAWLAVLLVSFASSPAIADGTPDRPLRTQTIQDADGDEIICTYYPDLVVRVTQTNTPAPGDATLIHVSKHPPACSVKAVAGTLLKTRGSSYIARRDAYLFFEEADPNGATGFSVIDARTGRAIVEDSTLAGISAGGSIPVIAATPVSLTMGYRRAVNMACSIIAEPARCWAAFTRDRRNAVPPTIARLAPPVWACAHSYALGKVDRNDPSIVAYEVLVNWKRGAGLRVQTTGPVSCLPLP